MTLPQMESWITQDSKHITKAQRNNILVCMNLFITWSSQSSDRMYRILVWPGFQKDYWTSTPSHQNFERVKVLIYGEFGLSEFF